MGCQKQEIAFIHVINEIGDILVPLCITPILEIKIIITEISQMRGDGCCVFYLYCDTWSCRCVCMRSMSVFVMHILYVCVLCASCGSSQCCVLHDLQFVNAGLGCKRQPYGRGILQSRSHDCLIGSQQCFLLFTPSC